MIKMQKILVDTNLIYYLNNISKNERFNLTLFKEDNNKIVLTEFPFLEIILKFQYNKEIFNKILIFLNQHCVVFVHKKETLISYNNIFKKCLESKNKLRYYREHFIENAINMFSDFMAELTLLLGGVYLFTLYKTDETKSEESFYKTIHYANDLFKEIYQIAFNNYQKTFKDFYTDYNKTIEEKQEKRKKDLNFQLIDIFRFYNLSYFAYKNLDNKKHTYPYEFYRLKEDILKKEICKDELSLRFRKYSQSNTFNNAFNSMYNKIFPDRNNILRERLLKYILNKFLMDLSFDFNDVIDCLNILSCDELPKKENIKYLTFDNKWMKFIQENQDLPFCKNNVVCLSKYTNN